MAEYRHWRGMSKALGNIAARGPKAQARTMRNAETAAQEAAQEARRLCPVDTGYLRSTIYGRVVADPTGWRAVVGASADYAGFVEYGTSRQIAQPFLRPAYQTMIERLADADR